MKKPNKLRCLQLLLCLCCLPILTTAGNLWSGSLVIGNWENYQSIGAESFSGTVVGDTLKISADSIDMTSAQLSLNNGNWVDLAGSGMVDLRTESYWFIVTSVMLSDLQSNGVVVRGKNFTLTSVDLNPGQGGEGLDDAIWFGETIIGDWSGSQTISAGSFANAQVGNLLRVGVKDLGQGAQGHLSNSSWGDLVDAEAYVDLSNLSYYEFTITAPMLTEIQTNGILVRGADYTIEGVYIIAPMATDVKPNGELSEISYTLNNDLLSIDGLSNEGFISIYNLNGIRLHKTSFSSSSVNVKLQDSGFYIVEIRSTNNKRTIKIIVR